MMKMTETKGSKDQVCMIIEYHRPNTLEEALSLLARSGVKTLPLGGGTCLNQPSQERFAVVDLQTLGLNMLERRGNTWALGATLTLQTLLENPGIAPALEVAIRQEASYNLRQAATAAGTLVSADGRSPFATALLALDAELELKSAAIPSEWVSLGDLLPIRAERLSGRLITSITLPSNARLAYESVARTPVDLPIVCVALARWPSGRVRLALGGFGEAPALTFDGPEAGGLEVAARDLYNSAGDEWASAEYRQDMAATLAKRCLLSVSG
jgi:CO/xanthine dehydrogenase FAD-binding subunit